MYEGKQKYTAIATLHINSITTGFLPSLGVRFLALMYRCIDEADFATLIVKYEQDELVGFVTGTLGSSNLYKSMMSHPFELFISLAPVMLNPWKLKRIINILSHIKGSERAAHPAAELLTICVNRDYRRRGIAEELYQRLSSYFKCEGISEFVIIVGQNIEANAFYVNQGAIAVDVLQVHLGANSNVYIQGI